MGTGRIDYKRLWRKAFAASCLGITFGIGAGCSVLDSLSLPSAAPAPQASAAAVTQTASQEVKAGPATTPVPAANDFLPAPRTSPETGVTDTAKEKATNGPPAPPLPAADEAPADDKSTPTDKGGGDDKPPIGDKAPAAGKATPTDKDAGDEKPATGDKTEPTPATKPPLGEPALPTAPVDSDVETLPIDLPTALRLTNVSNPTVALARSRLDEAYMRLTQVQWAWLPNLIAGPAYTRHDGQLQTSRGDLVEVNKSSLFVGGGVTASLETSQAYFAPLVARRLVDAEAAASRIVNNNVELEVALTYLDLLQVHAQLAINTDTLIRAEDLRKHAESARRNELAKLTADVNRARAEVDQVRRERIDLEADLAAVSARLAQLLLLKPTVDLRPAEPTVVPITLVPCDGSLDDLVATGLLNRPELAEGRALVGASLARWSQARWAPWLPRIDATYTGGTFGGGIDGELDHFNSRGDGSLQLVWTGHNLFLGDIAETHIRQTQYSQANLRVTEVEARVAAEIAAAAKVARARRRSLDSAQAAVSESLKAWERLRLDAYGLGNPNEKLLNTLDPLIAIQTLARARTDYLNEVIEYNKAQFRLFVAMGQPPVSALPRACATPPVDVPTAPPPPILKAVDGKKSDRTKAE